MKKTQLIFLLVVALAITLSSLMLDHIELNKGIVLSHADTWRLGFGPAAVLLSALLAIASILAYSGSQSALQFCAGWAAIYSVVNCALVMWHFPDAATEMALFSLVWSAVWYFWIRRWSFNRVT